MKYSLYPKSFGLFSISLCCLILFSLVAFSVNAQEGAVSNASEASPPADAQPIEQPPQSKFFMYDPLSRYVPDIKLAMEPADMQNRLLLPKNPNQIPSQVRLSFYVKEGIYGFVVLICDADNLQFYLKNEPSTCTRYEIGAPTDVVTFSSDGKKDYYILVINKARPVPVIREITVSPYLTIHMPDNVTEKTEQFLNDMMRQLRERHEIETLNFAVVPCRERYIPSNYKTRTITLCSELILGDTLAPDQVLLMMDLFYELVPFLVKDWELPILANETERIKFALTMMMTFIDNERPLSHYHRVISSTTQAANLWERMQLAGEFSFEERSQAIFDFVSLPYKSADDWMPIIYKNMTTEMLQNIRDKKLNHYGDRRNEARLIINRREGF